MAGAKEIRTQIKSIRSTQKITKAMEMVAASKMRKVQGRGEAAGRQMLEDALLLEQAGADIILLELVPQALAAEITRKIKVPVIGIGAGPDVDGQILVLYDMLDITPGRRPKFVRNFMAGAASPRAAVESYVNAVRDGSYPAPEHCFD